MSRYVLKFGGTSVSDIDRIKKVASIINYFYKADNELVVVASAMAGVTNQLISWVSELSKIGSS